MTTPSTSTFDVDEALRTARILVCCGSGGVGKTTTAAALALRGAELGRRTVVLTIDPAKRLAQSMGNLLHNAAKFTPVGGEIRLNVSLHGETVRIAVSDNGIGIAEDNLSRIFGMFAQAAVPPDRAPEGLGIGLSLVRGIVELHGGSVCARSDGPGRGSEFSMRLPLATGAVTEQARVAHAQPVFEHVRAHRQPREEEVRARVARALVPAEAVAVEPPAGLVARVHVEAAALGVLGTEPFASVVAEANEVWLGALADHFVASGVQRSRAPRAARLVEAAFMGLQLDEPLEPPAEVRRSVRDLADAVTSLWGPGPR